VTSTTYTEHLPNIEVTDEPAGIGTVDLVLFTVKLWEGGDGTEVGADDRDEDDRLEGKPRRLRGDDGAVSLERWTERSS
jgi:hypothetical protein